MTDLPLMGYPRLNQNHYYHSRALYPPNPSLMTTAERPYLLAGAGGSGELGSKVCSWPGALMTFPPSTCAHTGVPDTHGSASISSIVALLLGFISSILPIIFLLSRGRRRSSLHGPLITSCLPADNGSGVAAAPASGVDASG